MKDKLKALIALAALAASAAFSLAIHQRAESQARDLEKEFQDQAKEVSRRAEENAQLSNMLDGASGKRPLAGEKLAALLKLRNEVGQLRRSNAEMARLQSRNQKLRAALDKNEAQLAAAKSLPNYWPKDQLSHSGFADPSSAMKSILAAMAQGDAEAWRNACAPSALGKLEREWKDRNIPADKQDAEIKSMADGLMSSAAGFHIIDISQPNADSAVVQLSFDGQGKNRAFTFKRIGNEWKFDDLTPGAATANLPQ